jgi:hypothetical protein
LNKQTYEGVGGDSTRRDAGGRRAEAHCRAGGCAGQIPTPALDCAEPVAVHKQPVPVDFVNIMSNDSTIVGSMGYPDEIFEVTKDLVANWEKYLVIVSHTIPFENVAEALHTASTPGAADKVVVTFN